MLLSVLRRQRGEVARDRRPQRVGAIRVAAVHRRDAVGLHRGESQRVLLAEDRRHRIRARCWCRADGSSDSGMRVPGAVRPERELLRQLLPLARRAEVEAHRRGEHRRVSAASGAAAASRRSAGSPRSGSAASPGRSRARRAATGRGTASAPSPCRLPEPFSEQVGRAQRVGERERDVRALRHAELRAVERDARATRSSSTARGSCCARRCCPSCRSRQRARARRSVREQLLHARAPARDRAAVGRVEDERAIVGVAVAVHVAGDRSA